MGGRPSRSGGQPTMHRLPSMKDSVCPSSGGSGAPCTSGSWVDSSGCEDASTARSSTGGGLVFGGHRLAGALSGHSLGLQEVDGLDTTQAFVAHRLCGRILIGSRTHRCDDALGGLVDLRGPHFDRAIIGAAHDLGPQFGHHGAEQHLDGVALREPLDLRLPGGNVADRFDGPASTVDSPPQGLGGVVGCALFPARAFRASTLPLRHFDNIAAGAIFGRIGHKLLEASEIGHGVTNTLHNQFLAARRYALNY